MDSLFVQYPYLEELLKGILGLSYTHIIMWIIGGILIWLAVKYDYEPALLLPIGFGAILANIPYSSAVSTEPGAEGFLISLYNAGIANELFPVLIFVAIGAMCDFAPLIRRPSVMLFAAAAQFGIFATAIGATFLGFSFPHASSIGIIGAADGPTTIYVASRYAVHTATCLWYRLSNRLLSKPSPLRTNAKSVWASKTKNLFLTQLNSCSRS